MIKTTTAAATFTKGQAVSYFSNWNDKGTVKVHQLFVHSCGKKQMILVDANGEKFAGRNFRPQIIQWGFPGAENEVRPRLEGAELEAAALELGARIIAYQIATFTACIARTAPKDRIDTYYVEAMQEKLDEVRSASPAIVR